MSEMAPEKPPAVPAKGGNVFTRRIGPLPMWVWLVIVGAAILAYELYKSKSSSGGSTTSAADVPEFVNQVYGTPLPPVVKPPIGLPPVPDDDDGGKKKPGHKPPVAYGPERREATGKETLADIARERHTSVAHLIAVTKASQISAANLKKFLAAAAHPHRKLPKGLVYYTSH